MLKLILTLTLAPAMLTPVSDTFISRDSKQFDTDISINETENTDIPCYNESESDHSGHHNPSFISKDGFAFYWLKD